MIMIVIISLSVLASGGAPVGLGAAPCGGKPRCYNV